LPCLDRLGRQPAGSHRESPSVSTPRSPDAGGPAFGPSWQMREDVQSRRFPRLPRPTGRSTGWFTSCTA
jgi:hypothetical protein